MKKALRKLFLDFFGKYSKPANGVHVLNGHYLSRTNGQSEIFNDQLKGLQQVCSLIRIEDAVSMIVNGTIVNEPLVAFTFDDGFEECATSIAPVLEVFNINAAFFINPNFIDGNTVYLNNFLKNVVSTPFKQPMSWEQIIGLQQKGHIIGSHTLDHIRLDNNDTNILNFQLLKSKQIIELKTNTKCEYFAYPYGRMGDLSETALTLAKKHYKYIFSQSNHKRYFSFNGSVINRRHFEPDWSVSHVKYFISVHKN